ncbi:Sorting and assembly machinery component 50 [Nymphon striatum]|nr:Sorting and assembly machinery component 50 [Nymphon striatum]
MECDDDDEGQDDSETDSDDSEYEEAIPSSDKASKAKRKLESVYAFKEVEIFVDTCKGKNNSSNEYEVTFHLLEMKRLGGGVNTTIGNNSGSLTANANLTNLFGRGEKLQLEYLRGTQQTMNCNLTFLKPIIGNRNTMFTSAIFQEGSDLEWCNINSLNRGALIELAFNSSPKIKHRIRCEGIWRELNLMSNQTIFKIRKEMGHSLKCSLKHSLVLDHRNNPILPKKGFAFKLNNEFAGLGGDVSFHKHEVELQLNKSILCDVVIQGSIIAGIMKPASKRSCSITDKFFIGGPLSLRGFKFHGCGPVERGLSFGANSYWAAALHLFAPLPFSPGKGKLGDLFKTHFFINVGDIDDNLISKYSSTENILKSLRVAYGGGIIFRLGQDARFELNYVVPIQVQSSDLPVHGLQFGVGVSFL